MGHHAILTLAFKLNSELQRKHHFRRKLSCIEFLEKLIEISPSQKRGRNDRGQQRQNRPYKELQWIQFAASYLVPDSVIARKAHLWRNACNILTLICSAFLSLSSHLSFAPYGYVHSDACCIVLSIKSQRSVR